MKDEINIKDVDAYLDAFQAAMNEPPEYEPTILDKLRCEINKQIPDC